MDVWNRQLEWVIKITFTNGECLFYGSKEGWSMKLGEGRWVKLYREDHTTYHPSDTIRTIEVIFSYEE